MYRKWLTKAGKALPLVSRDTLKGFTAFHMYIYGETWAEPKNGGRKIWGKTCLAQWGKGLCYHLGQGRCENFFKTKHPPPIRQDQSNYI